MQFALVKIPLYLGAILNNKTPFLLRDEVLSSQFIFPSSTFIRDGAFSFFLLLWLYSYHRSRLKSSMRMRFIKLSHTGSCPSPRSSPEYATFRPIINRLVGKVKPRLVFVFNKADCDNTSIITGSCSPTSP
jgi:hypothetical protein